MENAGGTDPRKHLFELLQKFDTGMLTTTAVDGSFHARPLRVAAAEDDGGLWFATSASSGKVDEIQADQTCGVTFQSTGGLYLAFTGTASVVTDRAKIAELWAEPMRVWFPDGPDDPDIALLRVALDKGEYWDNDGVSGLKYLFRAAKAYVSGNRPETDPPDEHGVVRGVRKP
ncbi:MAG: pyridoxamine 5'-phosphate oxidase family protein [Deltaproteobacteria bacterium]|nr:pyridoxamine 5'-phosphate oxidase family protein [Deltaproteobacteria bacterium]